MVEWSLYHDTFLDAYFFVRSLLAREERVVVNGRFHVVFVWRPASGRIYISSSFSLWTPFRRHCATGAIWLRMQRMHDSDGTSGWPIYPVGS